MTGRKRTKTSGIERTGKRKEREAALKAAGDLETKLRGGFEAHSVKVTWPQFRQRYENEVLPRLAERTAGKIDVVFNAIERILSPAKLRDLTAERLSFFQAELRRGGRAEATIKSMLAHLGAALRWAKRMKLIQGDVPTIDMPERAGDKMRGRPLTLEEAERMFDVVERVLIEGRDGPEGKRRTKPPADKCDERAREVATAAAKAAAPSWRYFLRGLWLSGLRLEEALNLSWDDETKILVDLSGKRPMFQIPASREKGNKNRTLAIAPEFAEFLLETPADQRQGFVFNLGSRKLKGEYRLTAQHAGRIISQCGERAGVKVGTKKGPDGKPAPRFASAHDFRRSFGER